MSSGFAAAINQPAKPDKAQKPPKVIFYGLHGGMNPLRFFMLLLRNASINNNVITLNSINYTATDGHITASFRTDRKHTEMTPTYETAIANSTRVEVTFHEIRIGPSHIVAKASLSEGAPYNGHHHVHMTIGVVEGAKPVDSPKLFETDNDVEIIAMEPPVVVPMTYYAHTGR